MKIADVKTIKLQDGWGDFYSEDDGNYLKATCLELIEALEECCEELKYWTGYPELEYLTKKHKVADDIYKYEAMIRRAKGE